MSSSSKPGKRMAERPPRRSARLRRSAPPTRGARAGGSHSGTPAEPTPEALPEPTPEALPETPSETPSENTEPGLGHAPSRWLLALWFVVVAAGTAALVVAAFDVGPAWLDGGGAVAVATALSWFLASRTAGRAFISALVALTIGSTALLLDEALLLTGASVMTCVVGGVYAVMATVPAATFARAVREVLVATGISGVTALAAVGFEPTIVVERYDFVTLLVALIMAFAIIYRLGAGLHGLGRRGLISVGIGLGVMVVTLAYAQLLRRYGAQDLVATVLDFVDWSRQHLGAFPRPLVVLLGIPALVWGTHLRARRRQGWWVCLFGIAATVPMAAGLVPPDGSYLEASLRVLYSLVLGLVIGYLVIRADLALSGSRGAGARRAERAEAHRPEPPRFSEL